MSERLIRFLDEAHRDLKAGRVFYNHLQQGVGTWFNDSVLADIESLYLYAGIHTRHRGHFRLLAKRFPYAVYYDVDAQYITIVAILPLRRDPGWITGQLKR